MNHKMAKGGRGSESDDYGGNESTRNFDGIHENFLDFFVFLEGFLLVFAMEIFHSLDDDVEVDVHILYPRVPISVWVFLNDFVLSDSGYWIASDGDDSDLLGDDGVSNVSYPRIASPRIDLVNYLENSENSA